jgi:tetratricopeptide (TPR) repeat protein
LAEPPVSGRPLARAGFTVTEMTTSQPEHRPRRKQRGQQTGQADSSRAERKRERTSRQSADRKREARSGQSADRKREAKSRQPADGKRAPLGLSDDIVAELHATARPGKGGIAVKVFGEAAAAFAEEDFAEAVRLGEQAKHIALRSVAVRELLGLAHYRSGRYRDAARELLAFRRISGTLEQNPVLADCYRATGRPERALELCDEVPPRRVEQPTFYETQIVAAGALADLGRLDDAVARLERLDLEPETAQEHHLRAWYALAGLLERRGRFTQARRLFEAVAATDPELTDAAERVRRLSGREP